MQKPLGNINIDIDKGCKGFTLIEYVTVVTIMTALLVASVTLSISGARNTLLKKNYMRSMLLDIRTIQNYALAVRPLKAGPGVPADKVGLIPKAYGVFIPRTSIPDAYGYFLFADMPTATNQDGDRVYNNSEDITLKTKDDTKYPKGYRVSFINNPTATGSNPNRNEIHITFEPPNAKTAFKYVTGSIQTHNARVMVTLRNNTLNDNFYLEVYDTGRITVR